MHDRDPGEGASKDTPDDDEPDQAREGVVDTNCQIYGVDGIFIAGTSVFPTISHANPTFMLVTLAVRLADWLKANVFRSTMAPTNTIAENV